MDKWMEKSLEYERAYTDAMNKAHHCAEIGMYGLEEKYKRDAAMYRIESDKWFALHKANTEVFDSALVELFIAVLRQATRDYERALCNGDTGEQKVLEKFLNESLAKKVRRDRQEFIRKAHEDFDDILAVTVYLRKKKWSKDNDENKHRCPNCGGGMYVKAKVVDGKYIVGCSGCDLREYVERRQKPDAS